MTIEIKQLVIRATVQQGAGRAAAAAPSAAEPLPAPPAPAPAAPALNPDLEALVEACARQVLRELRKRGGR